MLKELAVKCKNKGKYLVIEDELEKFIKLIKEMFIPNCLINIEAKKLKDGNVELVYHIYTIEDKEDILIKIVVAKNVESIKHLYTNAENIEKEIEKSTRLYLYKHYKYCAKQ